MTNPINPIPDDMLYDTALRSGADFLLIDEPLLECITYRDELFDYYETNKLFADTLLHRAERLTERFDIALNTNIDRLLDLIFDLATE